MFQLIKMDLKKYKLKACIYGVIVLLLGLIGFTTIAMFASRQDAPVNGYTVVLKMVNIAVIDSILVFSSVLIAKIIIEEYSKKTILVMFSYPINRKKLIASKLLIIAIFGIICNLIGNLCCVTFIVGVDYFVDIVAGVFETNHINQIFEQLIIGMMVNGIFILIPFIIGMYKKSVSAAVVSSAFVIILIQMIISQSASFVEILFSIAIAGGLILLAAFYTLYKKVDNVEAN